MPAVRCRRSSSMQRLRWRMRFAVRQCRRAVWRRGDPSRSEKRSVCCLASPLELPHALRRSDHVRETDAELLVDDHHFALCDQAAVDEQVQWLAGETFELDDRALRELQNLANRNPGAAELDGELNRYVEDEVDVVAGTERTRLRRELLEDRCGLHLGARDHRRARSWR